MKIKHDKALHFGAGTILGLIGGIVTILTGIYYAWALLLPTISGIAKEVYDRKHGVVDKNDIVFTIGGGILGFFIFILYMQNR